MQQQRTLDYADAQKALTVIVAELQRRNAIGVIAVADNHGELIAFARMDGAVACQCLSMANASVQWQ